MTNILVPWSLISPSPQAIVGSLLKKITTLKDQQLKQRDKRDIFQIIELLNYFSFIHLLNRDRLLAKPLKGNRCPHQLRLILKMKKERGLGVAQESTVSESLLLLGNGK